jgi:predicted metalloprotease
LVAPIPAQAETPVATPQAYRGSDDEFQYAGTFTDLALDIDAFWKDQFANEHRSYRSPNFAALDRVVETSCGYHGPEAGAFYCQLDLTIYLSPSFLAVQDAKFGDYAPIVVLAHEWGHHVQNLLQIPDPGDNSYELQADCLAGAYTLHAEEQGFLEPGDLAEAIRISEESGDPVGLPQDRPGAHGTNVQRMKAVMRGYLDGAVGCNLFGPSPTPTPTPIITPTRPPDESLLWLPASLPLPHASCFRIEDEGTRSFDELTARLGGTADAKNHLVDWGWRQSVYRVFACDTPPRGEAGWIEVDLHVFNSETAAREAVDYFSAQRAAGTRLLYGAPPPVGDHGIALSGPASNGKEFTIYVSQGPLLMRVTGVSSTGIPFSNVLAVARSVLAAQQMGPRTASAPAPPPLSSAYPATAYLPAYPAVNYAECFRVFAQGTYAYTDIVAALTPQSLTADQIDGLGWTDGAYIDFTCADPPSGRATLLEVVIHQFRDAQLARQALPYFDRTYAPGAHETRSCDVANALVICVTGRSLSGSPLSDVHFVLNQVVAAAR